MKNLQRGFIVPFLITIVALLVVGGGVYIYSQNKNTQTNNAENNVVQSVSSTTTVSNNTDNIVSTTSISVFTSDNKTEKVFACDNSYYPPSENKANINGEVAGLKSLNFELIVYLNDHTSYPTSLADFDNHGTKEDYSNTGYLYAYYPKVNPTHYHIGMKIQSGASCNKIVASNLKIKANFDSKTAGYENGFDGTDASVLDFHQ